MKFVHLSPGSGGSFYCENCLRDTELVLSLRLIGHDASCVPLYLPLMTDAAVDERLRGKVFFGGINVYLQQKSRFFRRTPRWLDRIFDAPWLLGWAGRKAGMTNAPDVAQTMLSMLRGELGRQVKELDRLVTFLAQHERPDVVSLSNVLLAGLVRQIKRVLAVPVVCSLQDEEGYLDSLDEPYRGRAWEILRRRAAEIDAFIAPSDFYSRRMQQRLALPGERFRVIHNAIDPAGLAPASAPPAARTVGFMSQMTAGKGLDTLAEALVLLRRRGGFDDVRLRVFGGATEADEPFVRRVRRRLDQAGLSASAKFAQDFHPDRKLEFLQSCSVLSVPTRRAEAFGFFVLESLACAVPVVLPAHGAFPELIAATGGGLLHEPNAPADLADKLAELLSAPARAAALGQAGRKAVIENFSPESMARKVEWLCRELGVANATAEAQRHRGSV
jgi:glycosyltransferase involved in cell wall biosynthesis